MKRLPIYIMLIGLLAAACSDEDKTWEDYTDWREANEAWLSEQATRTNPDGTPYYTKVVPTWDPAAYILIHYFNDRRLTQGKLSPLFTSTVDVKYMGRLYNDEPFDSSYLRQEPADSVYRTACNKVIQGWTIALEDMRVGDTCEVLIPYQQGYGASNSGVIKPYSALKFGIKLVDIPFYEVRP